MAGMVPPTPHSPPPIATALAQEGIELPVSGPSFGWTVRLLTGAFLSWIALLMAQAPVREGYARLDTWVQLAMITCVVIMLAGYWYLFTGKTTLTADGISQSWLWRKQMQWSEVKSARFMGLPYLAWLIPPRLLLTSERGRRVLFNGGCTALHRAFAQATVVLQSRRYGLDQPASAEHEHP